MLPLLGAAHVLVYGVHRRRVTIVATGVVLLLLFVLLFKPFFTLLPHLGIDSFREGVDFDPAEALFYLSTLGYSDVASIDWLKWALVAIIYLASLSLALRRMNRASIVRKPGVHLAMILLLIVPSMVSAIFPAWQGFRSVSDDVRLMEANFLGDASHLEVARRDDVGLSVLLYVGESSSRMHWGLYGYPRATNAALRPFLDRGLLVFDNVSATHSHTSQSLLEALSVPRGAEQNVAPILQQERVSVVSLLSRVSIETILYSNHGRTGSWNLTSRAIFGEAAARHHPSNRALGNFDFVDDRRLYDHELLDRFLVEIEKNQDRRQLLVFHSYAGHGDYKDHIPPSQRRSIDEFYKGFSGAAIFGAGARTASLDQLEAYDSAVRYASQNLARTLDAIDRSDRPLAFVYFSDHGESLFTGWGHDSARYVWEMGAVPFLVYFNAAAREEDSDLYERLRSAAVNRTPETLARLPELLFDLLGVELHRDGAGGRDDRCGFATGRCLPRHHVVRALLDGTTSVVALPGAQEASGLGAVDRTDDPTALNNLALASSVRESPAICVHRANSLASIIRGRAIAQCLEMDVVIAGGEVKLFHPPAKDVGLTFAKAVATLNGRPTTLWLDAKNLANPGHCSVLEDAITEVGDRSLRLFIEFPPESVHKLASLGGCARALRERGAVLSYYVPTREGLDCQEQVSRCDAFVATLRKAIGSGIFTDLSFDHSLRPLIERVPSARALRWNSWSVDRDNALETSDYRLVIPTYHDPNRI